MKSEKEIKEKIKMLGDIISKNKNGISTAMIWGRIKALKWVLTGEEE